MRLVVVSLVVLVALAGCFGGSSPDRPTPPTANGGGGGGEIEIEGTAGSSPTAASTAASTEMPSSSEAGLDEQAALDRHQQVLASSSYRMRVTVSGQQNATYREAASAGRYPLLTHTRMESGFSTAYWARAETFGITNTSGIVSFARSSVQGGTFIPTFFRGNVDTTPVNRHLRSYLLTVEFTRSGTRTVEGTRYTVYVANSTGALAANAGQYGIPNSQSVTGLDARLLIDDRDIIRSFRATYTYPDRTVRVNATVRAVGQIRVQQPEWLPQACQTTNFSANVSVDCQQGLAG